MIKNYNAFFPYNLGKLPPLVVPLSSFFNILPTVCIEYQPPPEEDVLLNVLLICGTLVSIVECAKSHHARTCHMTVLSIFL